MSDEQEINRLRELYVDYFDSRNAAAFITLFTQDGVMAVPGGKEFIGKERLALLVERTPPGGKHIPLPSKVEINGDVALGRVPYRMELPDGNVQTGTYDDQFLRTPEGWCFSRRAIIPDA